jgi:hypothetical protein
MQLEKEVSVQIETFKKNLTVNIDWDASETILRPRDTLIIGGLSFGTEPSSLTSAISLTSLLPKMITTCNSKRL